MQEFTTLLPYKASPTKASPPQPPVASAKNPAPTPSQEPSLEPSREPSLEPSREPSQELAPLPALQQPVPGPKVVVQEPGSSHKASSAQRKRVKARGIVHMGPDSKAFMGLKAHSKYMHSIWPLGKRKRAK